MKDKYHKQWEKLGASDPYWAVLTDPNKKGGKWNRTDFFSTGENEVNNMLTKVKSLGIEVKFGSALDFGWALAARFSKVIAIDVSRSMLNEAQKANQHIGNIDFIHNIAEDLSIIPEDSIDCLYTNLVLQHMPKKRQVIYIREFCRVLRPKGILVMQMPARSNLKSWKGWVYLLTGYFGTSAAGGGMEMHTISKKTVLETLDNENMSVINVERLAGGHPAFVRYRYFAEKS